MVVVFDCLFEFAEPVRWMQNTRTYLKLGGRLVIVDPDPSKFGSPEHFLSRKQIHEYARESGYAVVRVESSFLNDLSFRRCEGDSSIGLTSWPRRIILSSRGRARDPHTWP
jgi:hypothetical protein